MTDVNLSFPMRQLSFGIATNDRHTALFYEKYIKNIKVKINCVTRTFAVRQFALRAYNLLILA